jgi:hypothetical protein
MALIQEVLSSRSETQRYKEAATQLRRVLAALESEAAKTSPSRSGRGPGNAERDPKSSSSWASQITHIADYWRVWSIWS